MSDRKGSCDFLEPCLLTVREEGWSLNSKLPSEINQYNLSVKTVFPSVSYNLKFHYRVYNRLPEAQTLPKYTHPTSYPIKSVVVKEYHYRPGQALRFVGDWSYQISRQWAHEDSKFVSPMHRPPLPQRKYSWYSFLLEAELTPRDIVKPEVLCK